MSTVIVRYETKPEKADENQELVENVFKELNAEDPGGLKYMTIRVDDTQFVHIAQTPEGANSPVTDMPAFKEFQSEIKERCVQPPNPTEATVVGSYGFGDLATG